MARPTRQSSRSSSSVDSLFSTDHLHTEEQEFLAEQALLELIESQRTPSLPSSSPRRRRSHRSSARTPVYDPHHPNPAVREASIPYDPAAWEAISLAKDVRRPSFSPLTRHGSSSRTSLHSPGRTLSQRHSLEYDPRTPLFGLGARPPAGVLYDPARIQYHRSSSAALGAERSPAYSQYGYGTESGGDDESAQDNTIAQQIENAVQRALREVLPSLLREELEGWMLERLREMVANGARSQPVSPSALKSASRRASSASRSGGVKRVSFEEVRGEVGNVSWGPRKRGRKVLSSEGVSPTGISSSRGLTVSFLEASSPEKSPKETSSRTKKSGKQLIASAGTARSSRTQTTSRGGKGTVAKASKKVVAPRKKAAARLAPKGAATSKSEAPRRSVRVRGKLQGAVSKAG